MDGEKVTLPEEVKKVAAELRTRPTAQFGITARQLAHEAGIDGRRIVGLINRHWDELAAAGVVVADKDDCYYGAVGKEAENIEAARRRRPTKKAPRKAKAKKGKAAAEAPGPLEEEAPPPPGPMLGQPLPPEGQGPPWQRVDPTGEKEEGYRVQVVGPGLLVTGKVTRATAVGIGGLVLTAEARMTNLLRAGSSTPS